MHSPLELCHTIMFYLPDAEVQKCCKDRREAIFAQEAVVHGLDHDLDAKEEARKLYHTTLITPCSCGRKAYYMRKHNGWLVEDKDDQ